MRPFYIAAVLSLVSCNNAFDAESVANDYCDCMKENGAPKSFEQASKVCDEVNVRNRYVRLWTIDMNDRKLDSLVSDNTRDSVSDFIGRFTEYTVKHCCKETLACP